VGSPWTLLGSTLCFLWAFSVFHLGSWTLQYGHRAPKTAKQKVIFSLPLPNRKGHFFYVPLKPKYGSPGPLLGFWRLPCGFMDPPIWPPSFENSSQKKWLEWAVGPLLEAARCMFGRFRLLNEGLPGRKKKVANRGGVGGSHLLRNSAKHAHFEDVVFERRGYEVM
jgi:hypothetical protein